MTLPTFDPIPFPILPTECDGVDAFKDVSTVAGNNFDRFKTFWGSRRNQYQLVETQRVPSIYATIVQGGSPGFVDIPADQPAFPPCTFVIPAWAKLVWYQFFGYVSARDTGVNNYMLYTTEVAGSGLIYTPGPWQLGVFTRNYLFSGSRSFIWMPSQFNPGGTIVATPKVNWANASASPGGSTYYGGGVIQFIALG